jgi:hypothetical protein
MGRESKLKFTVPPDFDVDRLRKKLPSAVRPGEAHEIYGYSIEADGVHFIDHLVDRSIAALALRTLIDAALSAADQVEILEP